MQKSEYTYNTFAELFGFISYAIEWNTVPIYYPSSECIVFNKLTIFKNGTLTYKIEEYTYNPKLWPRVRLLLELFKEDNDAIDILYGEE